MLLDKLRKSKILSIDEHMHNTVMEEFSKVNNKLLLKVEDVNLGLKMTSLEIRTLSEIGFEKVDKPSKSILMPLSLYSYDFNNDKYSFYLKRYNNYNLLLFIRKEYDFFYLNARVFLDKDNNFLKNREVPSFYFYKLYVLANQHYTVKLAIIINFYEDSFKILNFYRLDKEDSCDFHHYDFNIFCFDKTHLFSGSYVNSKCDKKLFTWYVDGKKCTLNFIFDLFPHLEGEKLEDLFDYREVLSKDEVDLLMMSVI